MTTLIPASGGVQWCDPPLETSIAERCKPSAHSASLREGGYSYLDRHRKPFRAEPASTRRTGGTRRVRKRSRTVARHARAPGTQDALLGTDARLRHRQLDRDRYRRRPAPVSYTHLTLPTSDL